MHFYRSGLHNFISYLRGRNFGRKKFLREENLAGLAEFNLAGAGKI